MDYVAGERASEPLTDLDILSDPLSFWSVDPVIEPWPDAPADFVPEPSARPVRRSAARYNATLKRVKQNGTSAVMQKATEMVKKPKILGEDFKPARGRGRKQQLRKMTAEQKEAEIKYRLEKNRIAARLSRAKRKQHQVDLEEEVDRLKRDNAQLRRDITRMRQKLARLQ